MRRILSILGVLVMVLLGGAQPAVAQTQVSLMVRGDCNPYLSGMPNGTIASRDGFLERSDIAPDQSPVRVIGLALHAGSRLQFEASGIASYANNLDAPQAGADGVLSIVVPHQEGAEHGISNIVAPGIALLGVFLTDQQPNLAAAPETLDFSTVSSRDYTSLNPKLQQLFYIGDGRTDLGVTQDIIVPTGATRLFLGTMDGFGWFNNTGSFNVTVREFTPTSDTPAVPEPGALALFLPALVAVALLRRRPA